MLLNCFIADADTDKTDNISDNRGNFNHLITIYLKTICSFVFTYYLFTLFIMIIYKLKRMTTYVLAIYHIN